LNFTGNPKIISCRFLSIDQFRLAGAVMAALCAQPAEYFVGNQDGGTGKGHAVFLPGARIFAYIANSW
jgi:hypothetical protein